MRFANDDAFYAKLQRYVFVHPETFSPVVTDVSELVEAGTPIDDDGTELELFASLEPGESFVWNEETKQKFLDAKQGQ